MELGGVFVGFVLALLVPVSYERHGKNDRFAKQLCRDISTTSVLNDGFGENFWERKPAIFQWIDCPMQQPMF